MSKFIINHSVFGYDTVDIDDKRIDSKDNTIILILNESTNNLMSKYYNRVIDIILSGAKLIMIAVGNESKIRKTLFMLAVSYRNYNLYKINNVSLINDEYLQSIENREPDLIEVQQFIGGDISAYSELNTILFGINELINSNDLNGLKTFIEQHINSIDSSVELIEYLKRVSDATNSGEMNNIIESLKEKMSNIEHENSSMRQDIKQYKNENSRLSTAVESLKKDVANANKKAIELKSQLENNTTCPIITSYKEVNTSLVRCKAQSIIYFKELSYARYTNSLVNNIVNILKTVHHMDVKLMIYDSRVGMPGLYKGISILNTNDYLANKSKILRDTTRYVITEPNQVFIEDVLTSISPQFQVVIVYDRMMQPIDIVSGNNVTKVFVVNSASNFEAMKPSIRFSLGSLIISSEQNIDGCISIPEIQGYSKGTESAKISKYMKLAGPDGTSIINSILTKARVNMRPGNIT